MMQDYLSYLFDIGLKRQYKKDNIIFYEGEEARRFFIITSGTIRIYKSLTPTRELNLHYFKPLSFIAEMPAFKSSTYPANAVCMEDCEVVEIEVESFKNLCIQNAEFSFLMIGSLIEKIKILERELLQGALSVRNRLIRYILENEPNLSKISQRKIADSLNIRAESLSRSIKELRTEGLITTNKGKIIIVDRARLQGEV